MVKAHPFRGGLAYLDVRAVDLFVERNEAESIRQTSLYFVKRYLEGLSTGSNQLPVSTGENERVEDGRRRRVWRPCGWVERDTGP